MVLFGFGSVWGAWVGGALSLFGWRWRMHSKRKCFGWCCLVGALSPTTFRVVVLTIQFNGQIQLSNTYCLPRTTQMKSGAKHHHPKGERGKAPPPKRVEKVRHHHSNGGGRNARRSKAAPPRKSGGPAAPLKRSEGVRAPPPTRGEGLECSDSKSC